MKIKTSKICHHLIHLIAVISVSCATIKPEIQYTTGQDQYWENLVKLKNSSNQSIVEIIKAKNQILYRQIDADSSDSNLLGFWGQSFNFDSGAKKKILDEKILEELQLKFGVKNDNHIVHAGITHTYGYLFSLLETPYGFKRQRWIDTSLNNAFLLNKKSLSPETTEGSLLSNITYFSAKLAFLKSKNKDESLEKLKNVSPEIKTFDYQNLKVVTLKERLPELVIKTTFVSFLKKSEGNQNSMLLIYSVQDLSNHKEMLITAFPITIEAFNKITGKSSLGANQPISIRYNAYLPRYMDGNLRGSRKLE